MARSETGRVERRAAQQRRLGGVFVRLWTAVTVSGLGDGVRSGSFPLLAASVTRSPGQIAGVAFAQALPWLVFGLPSGVIADRWSRRSTLVWANVISAVIMVSVAIAVGIDHIPLPLLYAAAFGLTTVTVFADSAGQAILPDVVATEALERANGRLYTAQTAVAQFAGPPLGSLLFAVARVVPFAVDSLSFAASATLLGGLPRARPASGDRPQERLARSILAGLSWLRHQRILCIVTVAGSMNNIGSEMLFGIFPLFALHMLHIEPAQYGLLFLCYAVGAMGGGLVGGRVRVLVGEGPAITFAVLIFGLPLLAMALWPAPWPAAAMMAASGVGEGVWSVVVQSMRQAVVPEAIRGRVLASIRAISWGSLSVGALLGGVVGESLGVDQAAIVGCAAIVVTGVALAPFLRTDAIRRLREENAAPHRPAT